MPSLRTTVVTGNGSGERGRPAPPDHRRAMPRFTARKRSRILAGLVVLIVSSLAAAVLYADAGERRPVLAVARPVAAGQTIRAADLREVLVAADHGLDTLAANRRSQVIGRTAAVPLVPGSLLSGGQLAEGAIVDPDRAVVGALLKAGHYPAGLRAGDQVLAFIIPPDSATGDDPVPAGVGAVVVEVREGSDAASVTVSLAVDPNDAGALAIAAARGRLTLVRAPR